MEYSKRSKRFALTSLHRDLGGMDVKPCGPPKGLVFEAFMSDPFFEVKDVYHLKDLEAAGVFFDAKVGDKDFCLHQEDVGKLYSVDNFRIFRNYYVDMMPTTSTTQKTQELGLAEVEWPPHGAGVTSGVFREKDTTPQSVMSRAGSVKKGPGRNWNDIEDSGEEDETILSPSGGLASALERKQVTTKQEPKFFDRKFLGKLNTTEQRKVQYWGFVSTNPEFKSKDFYLFDFVAVFVTVHETLENQKDFQVGWLQERFKLLNSLAGTDWENIPMQHPENKGWSANLKLLCQSLGGEHQLSFLRVALAYAIFKIAGFERAKSLPFDPETRSFLNVDEAFKKDASQVIRLNLKALANSHTASVDEQYITSEQFSDVDTYHYL